MRMAECVCSGSSCFVVTPEESGNVHREELRINFRRILINLAGY
jgi:hypothetical protein